MFCAEWGRGSGRAVARVRRKRERGRRGRGVRCIANGWMDGGGGGLFWLWISGNFVWEWVRL